MNPPSHLWVLCQKNVALSRIQAKNHQKNGHKIANFEFFWNSKRRASPLGYGSSCCKVSNESVQPSLRSGSGRTDGRTDGYRTVDYLVLLYPCVTLLLLLFSCVTSHVWQSLPSVTTQISVYARVYLSYYYLCYTFWNVLCYIFGSGCIFIFHSCSFYFYSFYV